MFGTLHMKWNNTEKIVQDSYFIFLYIRYFCFRTYFLMAYFIIQNTYI